MIGSVARGYNEDPYRVRKWSFQSFQAYGAALPSYRSKKKEEDVDVFDYGA